MTKFQVGDRVFKKGCDSLQLVTNVVEDVDGNSYVHCTMLDSTKSYSVFHEDELEKAVN